ncbi:2-enoate reductase [Sphaerisporangium krabiense]|uniref:2,4-dienoyl-CoA reductase-like NADH-dependent reductase (Old Yellow Enzyme family)/thioredoxin reductase n=1 Tax=Sphaerisporangium krabiense TaxID=763782 RepID=A0A7W8Z8W1_9ACTN|nr:FAD-dependent oxidoreductase [Sphaerisporangium krabiense]MBB5629639.1 2,4-dienoyl-CoA reductase-like NADH-dependent reductase (Old Yellow Enzyme family)/thioredoxin reductase [Sphaerisporangium krabiense]GII63737.1 2-enoate reductase [Sphaerisporangium krabiense]
MVDVLFRPGRIGTLDLANRVIKSPQTTALSNQDGTVTRRLVDHYKRLAEGGPGLVLVEYSHVDDDASKSIHAQLGISRREHVPGLGWLVDEVHAAGSKIGIQLEHCGRQKFLGTPPIKSASAVSWDYVESQYGNKPVPLTREEIAGVVGAFADAAERAYLARFDLVEVHAGHGYLLTNFLSPHTNKRADEYGGSFENRARLTLEVVAAIRARVPRDFPLSVRLSVTDYEPDGIPVEETVELARLLEACGVDVIHASGGHHALMEYEVSPWFMPRALHRWGWEKIKEAVSIPVIASGSLVSPQVAAEVLESGGADFVSLGRAMLADPDWTRKAREGRFLDIVPCIRCNDGCLDRGLNVGRSTGCAVNPRMGEEYSYPVEPAAAPRDVAVAGGGPAGLRAAAVLADRGHRVTLFEPGELGGALNRATLPAHRQDLAALRDHLVHQVRARDVRVVPAKADVPSLTGYDLVYIATGATPGALPGASAGEAADAGTPAGEVTSVAVIPAREVTDPAAVAAPVVVVGGGITGADTALWLAGAGHEVTLVEAGPAILANREVFTDAMALPGILEGKGVTIITGAEVAEVTGEGVRTATGRVVPAATVLVATGRVPDPSLADALRAAAPHVEVVTLGDAARPGRVMDALHGAFFAARRA